ncbi:MAG: uracil phosphoribosyltransferase [Micavibrio sp.]
MQTHPDFPGLSIVGHPLVQHKLSRMRDSACQTGEFRRLLKEISFLIGYEVTRHLPLTRTLIHTPMQEMQAPVLSGGLPVVVPVLRAGLGMADGLVELMPDCHIGHIGLYRDEDTHRPVEYLVRLPQAQDSLFIVTDPMLATGHSSEYALDLLNRHGVEDRRIVLMCLVSAPEGVAQIQKTHPKVRIYTASLDERLDERAYILPGLGDAGDRLFGTL